MAEMNSDFVKVYASTLPHKVQIVRAVLEDNNILSYEVNKKDSAYTFMGEIDLFVNEKDAVLAKFLIKSNDL